jgi:hypothetical protein
MTTPTPLSDSLVAPLLVVLRDCVRTELARSTAGPVCRCAIAHSVVTPTMDGCDCECDDGQGDAWVRLVRLEPEESLETIRPSVCPTGWQAVIELGVYRCVPLPEEGEALEEQVVSDIALSALSDMNALIRVLGCCEALRDAFIGVEFWQPVGPSGGCAGGTLQFRVAISGGPGGC